MSREFLVYCLVSPRKKDDKQTRSTDTYQDHEAIISGHITFLYGFGNTEVNDAIQDAIVFSTGIPVEHETSSTQHKPVLIPVLVIQKDWCEERITVSLIC